MEELFNPYLTIICPASTNITEARTYLNIFMFCFINFHSLKNFWDRTIYFFEFCVIPKVFLNDNLSLVMKLTKPKVLEIIRMKNDGVTSYQARKIAGITVRKVD